MDYLSRLSIHHTHRYCNYRQKQMKLEMQLSKPSKSFEHTYWVPLERC
jgi:hypothetical protein